MQKTIHSKSYKTLTKWLKQQRQNQSLTIRELAKIIGVHYSIIWNIENAQRRLDLVEYVYYCQQLKANPMVGIDVILNDLD